MKPSLGRIVIFHGDLVNGMAEHPAIITRVWTDECVNLMVFYDGGVPISRTSIMFKTDSNKLNYNWSWPVKV